MDNIRSPRGPMGGWSRGRTRERVFHRTDLTEGGLEGAQTRGRAD